MKTHKTPKPDEKEYDLENPQHLNTPKFNSSTDRRDSGELPALENSNDLEKSHKNNVPSDIDSPKADLGNGKRKEDEDDNEKLITP